MMYWRTYYGQSTVFFWLAHHFLVESYRFQVAINVLPELVLALSALHLGKMLRWAQDEMISDGDTMGYPLVILNINI